jgi:hypothetical protein
MLRFTLAHPREYTHVLKADDDTWVRMHKVLEYLQEKQPMGSGGFGGSSGGGEATAGVPAAAAAAASAAAGAGAAGVEAGVDMKCNPANGHLTEI